MRVDELERLMAVADDVNPPVLRDPLKQNLEYPEPALPENGARTDDDERQPAPVAEVAHGQFAFQFGATINLHRRHRRIIGHRTGLGRAENGAGAHVNEALYARLHRLFGGDARAVHVHRPEFRAGLRQRHERDVVVDHVNALHRARHAADVPDVAANELDLRRARAVFPHVEHADALAALVQTARDEIAQKPRAAGDEVLHVRISKSLPVFRAPAQ